MRNPILHIFSLPVHSISDHEILSLILQNEQIDIIQVNDVETMHLLGYPLSRSLKLHTIYEAHYHTSTLAGLLGLSSTRIKVLKTLEQNVCAHSDEIIVFTEQDRERWIELSGCDEQRVSVVPFGIASVQSQAITYIKPKICFLGNMYYEPNERAVRRIVQEIFPSLKLYCPEVALTLIGDAPDCVRMLCKASGIELVGEVSNVADWLDGCSIGLAPYRKVVEFGRRY